MDSTKRLGRPPGIPNPNAGRPPGQPNPNAGRHYYTDLNRLFANLGVDFSEPYTITADVCGLSKCSACGSVWWEQHIVTLRGAHQEQPDTNGDNHPIIATVEAGRQPERHRKGCVMA